MCNSSCLEFGRACLDAEVVADRAVLEVGSRDVNGSLRPDVMALGPRSYKGVDIRPGPGVDEICDADRLVGRYGPEAFDVVICTEMLEHVLDWRAVIGNLKGACKPNGHLLITTRSKGFDYHEFPGDFWRYEPADMMEIFRDFYVLRLEKDPEAPGVFLFAQKPPEWEPADLAGITLYDIHQEL